jgi:hypothetical protein
MLSNDKIYHSNITENGIVSEEIDRWINFELHN